MIFALFLTLMFSFMAIYSAVFVKHSAARIVLFFCYGSGIFFIWNPDSTTIIAQYFGIGRGLDFILVLLSVSTINALIFVVRHVNDQHKNITKLSRHIALKNAASPRNGSI